MHILKNLNKIFFWTDYFIQDCQIRRKIEKLKKEDADFSKEEAFLRNKMLRYCRLAYPDYYKYYGLTGDEKLEEFPLISKKDMRAHPELFRTKYKKWIASHTATTGGSTGHPFGFELSANHDPVHQEFLWRLMGFQKGDKIICINGMSLPAEKTKENI